MPGSGKSSEGRFFDRATYPKPRRPSQLSRSARSNRDDQHVRIIPRRAIQDDGYSSALPDPQNLASRHTAWAVWLEPRFVVIAFSGLLALCTFLYPDSRFDSWSTTKYFNTREFILTLAAIIALCLGMTLSALLAPNRLDDETEPESDITPDLIDKWYHGTGLIVILGYLAWIVIAIARGATLPLFFAVLHRDLGAISFLKERLAPVSGVTTLTQLSCVVSALGAYRFTTRRKVGKIWCFVFFTGMFRALFYAERLALIEVILPAALILILKSRFTKRHRLITNFIPVIGVVFLAIIFSVSEYFRSWIYYSQTGESSFAPWVLDRLLGYYTTAFNNNALLYSELSGSSHPVYFTIPFVFDFPGVSAIFGDPSFGGLTPKDWWLSLLSWGATPEFNNSGSFLIPLADLGIASGLAFWVIIGLPIGYTYRRARQNSDVALITYSVLFLGLLELPRYVYWTLGRFFPAAVALIFFMGHAATHDHALKRTTPQSRRAVRDLAS